MRGSIGERRWLPWAVAAVLLLVAAADLLLVDVVLVPYYFILVVGAAIVLPPRLVVLLAALAAVLALAVGYAQGELSTFDYWVRLAAMGIFTALAVAVSVANSRREAKVAAAHRLITEVVEATDQPVFAKRYPGAHDEGAEFLITNAAWSQAVGVETGTAEGRRDIELFPPAMIEAFAPAERAVLETGQPVTVEQHVPGDDGARTFLTTLFPFHDDEDGHGIGGIATDVTERVQAEQRLAAVFAHSPVPTLRLVTGGARHTVVLDANEAVARMLGLDLVGGTSSDVAALVHPDDLPDAWGLVDRVVDQARLDAAGREAATGREIRVIDSSGAVRWVIFSVSAVGRPEQDGEQELIVQFEDITGRKQAEHALTERALTDSVTGLPNRYALSDRLATALARLGRHPGMVCVLFCDLDRFKQVNDVFGHATGDLLLQEAARRLSGAVRPEDTVGRQGGDEFVVVCEGLSDPREAVLLASRVQDRLRQRWSVGGHDFDPTTSIGIAFTDDPRCEPGDLLRQADVAMYRAKDSGRDRIELYDRSLDDELASALAMQQQLRAALEDDGLVVHYQPVVRLDDRSVVGAEALVRMRAPDGSLLGPDAFLPHAEAGGLIHAVRRRVLDTALSDVVAWRAAGLGLDVGVNASPTELARPDLVNELLAALKRHDADPSWIVLEVTETALVHEGSTVSATLQRLHSAGVRIALDDFGTGYSSLSWLHQFPVDIVKIDKSFVQTMADDHRRAVVVRAVVDIADETGLAVIAEGVETERQALMLQEVGCETAQGWLFGRPVPVDHPTWLALPRAMRN